MNLLDILNNIIYGDSPIFKEGVTTFLLSSDESQRFIGPFKCLLIKTVFNHKTKGYLIRAEKYDELGQYNFYIIVPKYVGMFFGRKKINDVYILEPADIDEIKISGKFTDESTITAWGHIYNIT